MLTNEERAEGDVEDGDWEDVPVELRKATKQFLEELGHVPLHTSNGIVPWKSAVKFLMARKFDVRRAVDLYIEHEKIRQREGIEGPDLRDTEIRRELLTQKFTVLPGRDKSGAAIALFRARYHHPEQTSHQATLQGLIFQLDAALESIETQRYGLVFIYDMTGSRYSNFDYDLSIKILNLLKGSYPARLKKVLIVTAPLWFKAPFKFLRLFVREKLRERVYTVDLSQLCHHIPTNVLPQYLGGKADFSHRAWLQVCLQQTWGSGTENEITAYLEGTDNFRLANDTSMSSISSCDDDFGGVGGATFSSDPESSLSSRSTINEKHTHEYREKEVILPLPSGAANMDTSDDDQSSSASANSPTKNGTPQLSRKRNLQGNAMSESVLIGDVPPPLPRKKCNLVVSAHDPIHVPDESGLMIDELVKYCKIKGKRGLYKEYAYVKLEPPTGRFEASKSKPNLPKNRYTDVLCLDQTRVKLNIVNDDTYSDYINANFLDGYKQKNAYISTQGPLPRTFGDFWRMVWEQMVLLVVMTTKTVERGRLKCGQYWPADKDSIDTYDDFVVINTGITEHTEYTITTLILQNSKTGETRDIRHLQFTSWPDYGVPDSAHAFLDFMHLVRNTQAERVKELGAHWTGDARGPPIVIHCSAGIGRTGTFITMDISTQRLADIHTVDIRNTVRRIRTQRAFSIQMPDQYIFCHLALIEHAQSLGLLSEVDLDGFNDESSEDD